MGQYLLRPDEEEEAAERNSATGTTAKAREAKRARTVKPFKYAELKHLLTTSNIVERSLSLELLPKLDDVAFTDLLLSNGDNRKIGDLCENLWVFQEVSMVLQIKNNE